MFIAAQNFRSVLYGERRFVFCRWILGGVLLLALPARSESADSKVAAAPPALVTATQAAAADITVPVMLGIDVLEADGFAAVKGKRLGLLTHPAGVNRRGVSTIDVLRGASGVHLVALYAVEHGIYNEMPAEKPFADQTDRRTGLPVFSLYNGVTKNFRPTPQQLKLIDALVIDLQDIGTRSYTFSGGMKSAMEACFEAGKEVIVLDRPNPLGGLKVGGPPLDADLVTDVGKFRVPYVHGMTIGELAKMALALRAPGGLNVTDTARAHGKLTIVPMRGWTRNMRWPDTGLPFVATSTRIQNFAAVMGYPMMGLGCIAGGFSHGIGTHFPFRGIHHPDIKSGMLERELDALHLPGVEFRRTTVEADKDGKVGSGLYVEITDYDLWQPVDLSFWLMKIAAQHSRTNPFAALPGTAKEREFLIHVGSRAFYRDLVANGANIDVAAWLATWRDQARVYQQQSKRFWLYQ
jgi:uncharacterized protein YbbC (DUF1343 family)